MDYHPVCCLTWMCFKQDFSFNAGKNYPRADITLEDQGGPSQVSSHSPKKEVPPEGPLALEPLQELTSSQPGPSQPAELGVWRRTPSSKQPLSPGPKRTFQALQESGEELMPEEGGSWEARWGGKWAASLVDRNGGAKVSVTGPWQSAHILIAPW